MKGWNADVYNHTGDRVCSGTFDTAPAKHVKIHKDKDEQRHEMGKDMRDHKDAHSDRGRHIHHTVHNNTDKDDSVIEIQTDRCPDTAHARMSGHFCVMRFISERVQDIVFR